MNTIVINPSTKKEFKQILNTLENLKIKHTFESPNIKNKYDAGQIYIADISNEDLNKLDVLLSENDWFEL